jgi:antitoxin VapB
MSLNIRSEEAERLARNLAELTGDSITGAITVALRERIDRVRDRESREVAERAARLRAISSDAGRRWVEPYRTADHGDLLYDEAGLPK